FGGGRAACAGNRSTAHSERKASAAASHDPVRTGERFADHLRWWTGMTTERNPTHVQENIATIAKIEEECLERRSMVERIGDTVGSFAGSMPFVVLHLLWFLTWVLINTRIFSWIPAFDPYPFIFLSMIVSLEAVLLSTFVLIKQNRMSKRADQRAQLDLQINLLTEKEVTKNLQRLHK